MRSSTSLLRRAAPGGRAGALLLLGVLVLESVAGPALAAGSNPYTLNPTGLSKMILGLNAGPSPAQNFSLGKGVQYYRIGINFDTVTIAEINRQARTVGVDYLGVLGESSLGVVRTGTAFHEHCSQNCNWTWDDWNSTVQRALDDYPTIHEWELWNEAYSPTQDSGFLKGASSYFAMTKSAYTLIKAFNRSDTVVCLGGSGVAISSAMTFTTAYWAYGASRYCDAVSLHAYISGNALFNTSSYERREWPHNLAQYENVTGKPVWITEYGRQTYEAGTKVKYSQLNQQEFLAQSTALFSNTAFVKRAYVFNLAGASNLQAQTDFGLLNATTLKPKLAWTTFLGYYASSLAHVTVATVTEKAPTLRIASLTVPKLVADRITATGPYTVDPIVIFVDNSSRASGLGSVVYNFTGNLLKKYTIEAYDKFTQLETTGSITVV